jgi:hypothetical protein
MTGRAKARRETVGRVATDQEATRPIYVGPKLIGLRTA